jgi:hypothetical protein
LHSVPRAAAELQTKLAVTLMDAERLPSLPQFSSRSRIASTREGGA